jgi:hypothetical protein
MTVNLRVLRRIDQGEEVEAADGAVGGDGQIYCVITIIVYPPP